MKKLTQQEVELYCLEHGYGVLSRYKGSLTKIKLQNIKTNAIGEMTFDSFRRGSRFDNPKAKIKLTYQQYIQPFIDEDYTVLIDEKEHKNIDDKTKINIICPDNHQWSVTRNDFNSKNSRRRCPMCNKNIGGGMSLGEKMVYQILQGNNITFEREKSVYINGNRYRFDFYFKVEEFGSIEEFFIEYDGEQHYHEAGGYMSGGLKKRQVSDEIKDKYAHDNNIQMVRIPWFNDTIDRILFVINGETGLNLKKVDVDLPSIREAADYYLNHERQETMDKFNVSICTVNRYFKQIYGMSKREYLKMIDTTK